MSKEEILGKLQSILDAHEMLMLEKNGRPDCKNCALAEVIQEQIMENEDE